MKLLVVLLAAVATVSAVAYPGRPVPLQNGPLPLHNGPVPLNSGPLLLSNGPVPLNSAGDSATPCLYSSECVGICSASCWHTESALCYERRCYCAQVAATPCTYSYECTQICEEVCHAYSAMCFENKCFCGV